MLVRFRRIDFVIEFGVAAQFNGGVHFLLSDFKVRKILETDITMH